MKEQSMGRILRRIRIEQGMTQEALVEGIVPPVIYHA